MAFTPSIDQEQVIKARNQNVLVSAAAGSGKTSVLTERIVGLVNDPVNPVNIDEILVVTFTNAAAREMKERIGKALEKLVQENPDNEHLQKQTTLIHSAQITTIDSFCLYLIKNHFTKIDLDPSFRVAGEGEIKLLKEDVLKDVIKRAYASKDPAFYHVVDCYAKRDKDDSLEKSVMTLFNYSMSYPYPVKWLEEHRKDYEYDSLEAFRNGPLLQEIRSFAQEELNNICGLIEVAIEQCLKPGGPDGYEPSLQKDMEDVSSLRDRFDSLDFEGQREALQNFSFGTLKGKSSCEESAKDYVKKLRDSYKKRLGNIFSDYYAFPIETCYEDMKAAGEVVNKVIDLVEDFIQSFDAQKRDRDIIDFSDMEHLAVQILIDEYRDPHHYTITDVAESYRKHFAEVMVDEYQDSNLVQELLIQAVSRERESGLENRFMVGDVKQSIYRFRLARPEIFSEKLESYIADEAAKCRLITLKENYRSRNAVIDSVNAVFETCMHRELGGVEYDADARLYGKNGDYSPDTEDNRTRIILVPKEENSEDARETEADAICRAIKKHIGTLKVFDKNEKIVRPASYKDVAVLFRAPTKWRDVIKDAFEKYHIPYHLEGVGAFFDTREIMEVMSFLKIVDNPLDDIALYAAMTSSFGKISDEKLAKIRGLSVGAQRFLWQKVKGYCEDTEDGQVTEFVDMVERYRKLSKVLPIHELITRLFDETGYRNIVAAMPDGVQRLANVNMLVNKATEYGKTSFYGLFHFLRYVELMKKLDQTEGEANTFDENADVVKVMSIHKSKGLEFPIVIVAGIDEAFNESDLKAEFVSDIDAGIGSSFVDPEKRIKRPTLKKKAIICKSRRESHGEEIRILYVAMTRAREKLILTGLCKNPEEWYSHSVSSSKNSYLDLIREAVTSKHSALFERVDYTAEAELEGEIASEVNLELLRNSIESTSQNHDEKLYRELRERFEFSYPHKNLERLYTKTTVSEIKMAAIEKEDGEAAHPFEENESREYIPLFAGGETEVKGTDRGTAYHDSLELLEFSKFVDCDDIRKELDRQFERMLEKGEMTKEDQAKVFKSKILDFLKTDVARDMMEADKKGLLYKEQPFVIGVPASTVEEDFPDSETLLVQGVIDVFFIKDGKVTVLDYKTDRVDSGEVLVERYRKQLEYYNEAVKQLTGLGVEAPLIYSFGLNATFVVN